MKYLTYLFTVCLLMAVFSFEDAQVENSASVTTDQVVEPSPSQEVNAANAEVSPDRVIALRLENTWSSPYSKALWEGTSNAIREVQATDVDVVIYDDTQPLDSDAGLVLATGERGLERLQEDSSTHPNTRFVVFDSPNESTLGSNVKSISFEEHEVSYLLGYLAGSLSQTGILGFVGDDTKNALITQAAFYQGIQMSCSACKLESGFVLNRQDAVAAKAVAQTLQSKGVDIFYANAGEASQGVIDFVNETKCFPSDHTRPSPLRAALANVSKGLDYLSPCPSAAPLFFMGTGRFQPELGDTDNNAATLNHGLTSIRKRLDFSAYEVIKDFLDGSFRGGQQQLGLNDNAVELAIDDYNRALLPPEVLAQLEALETQIVSGQLVVDTTPLTNRP
jgi:basic membrane protein A and related proteins